jgi:hypothetical protein
VPGRDALDRLRGRQCLHQANKEFFRRFGRLKPEQFLFEWVLIITVYIIFSVQWRVLPMQAKTVYSALQVSTSLVNLRNSFKP